jgi:hypothetical protein
MDIGSTMLLDDSGIEEHLWIVISDPGVNSERVVIVNLESHDSPEKDDSCMLNVGDHPWITHKTCVRYRDARIAKNEDLDRLVASGALKARADASNELLTKIFEGAEKTLHLPLKCAAILKEQGFIEA